MNNSKICWLIIVPSACAILIICLYLLRDGIIQSNNNIIQQQFNLNNMLKKTRYKGKEEFTIEKLESESVKDAAEKTKTQIIPRADWDVRPTSSVKVCPKITTSRVIISHTSTVECYSQPKCINVVRSIYVGHYMSPYDPDFEPFKYHFLIGGDGLVYELRGWNDCLGLFHCFTLKLNDS